jgi:hypothetical protein
LYPPINRLLNRTGEDPDPHQIMPHHLALYRHINPLFDSFT